MEISNELTKNEKVLAMRTIFNDKPIGKFIKNPADFLAKGFDKLEGFEARWTSLITNNPLLFEDIDYVRIKPFVNNKVTEAEIEAYKNGDLREIYPTFDHLLMSNLKQYDRIMNFCSMIFLHFVRIYGDVVQEHMKDIPWELEMTPSRLACCALTSINSTEWELNYAWSTVKKIIFDKPIQGSNKSLLELNWKKLYKNRVFAKFMEFSALRCGTVGFRETFIADITSNRKLADVCSKFTKTSTAISQQQLDSLYSYVVEIEDVKESVFDSLDKAMSVMYAGHKEQYTIFVFESDIFIFSSKFKLRIAKNEEGNIIKEFLANSYECFMADEYLVSATTSLIKWAKHIIPVDMEYDKAILRNLLTTMLEQSYREIICIKRMNEFGMTSKITFKGSFDNVRAIEVFYFNENEIHRIEKTLSKSNMAKYIVDRGYYIFGLESDVLKILPEITKQTIIEHYSNYCVPIFSHMKDVINLYELNRNEIIDVICTDYINPEKLENETILYTDNVISKERDLMSVMLKKQYGNQIGSKKSYWGIIDNK